jgi:hypothetical protein
LNRKEIPMNRLWIAAAAAMAVSFQPVSAADDIGTWVVPPGEAVADRTQEMWSARWWQWAASFQYAQSPVADVTGAKCAAGQEGEVFFLAGTFERRPVQRECRVPAGKHLFFPLVNYVVKPDGSGVASDCGDVVATAKSMTNPPMTLVAELDGKSVPALQKHRQATKGCFNLAARAGGPPIKAASNGYWLMLKPLPKGSHTLKIGGELPSLTQDITYTLIVE